MSGDLIPPSLQFGDFSELGLTGWGPPGIVARSFEWIQVATGMPWFYTIIVVTILWRLALAPFAIRQIRNTAILRSFPQIEKSAKDFKAAKTSGNIQETRIALLRYKKALKDSGVAPGATLLMSFIQIPAAIGVFLAVKRMCELPVEQLKQSGLSFVPDLTLSSGTAAWDPYYIMPILGVVMVNIQIKVSVFNDFPSVDVLRYPCS